MLVVYLTREVSSILDMGSGGCTVRFTLYWMYSWVLGLVKKMSNLDWVAFKA